MTSRWSRRSRHWRGSTRRRSPRPGGGRACVTGTCGDAERETTPEAGLHVQGLRRGSRHAGPGDGAAEVAGAVRGERGGGLGERGEVAFPSRFPVLGEEGVRVLEERGADGGDGGVRRRGGPASWGSPHRDGVRVREGGIGVELELHAVDGDRSPSEGLPGTRGGPGADGGRGRGSERRKRSADETWPETTSLSPEARAATA